MKLSNIVDVLITVVCLIALCLYCVEGHASETTIIKHTEASDQFANGFWQKRTMWKPRWVKYWSQKAIYVPVWKKVWGPVVQSEWVPMPKPPPGWDNERSKVSSLSSSSSSTW